MDMDLDTSDLDDMATLDTVGDAREAGFVVIGRTDHRRDALRDRYNTDLPVLVVQPERPPAHTIAYAATCTADGAPLKRLQ
jgi:hypothetical protein